MSEPRDFDLDAALDALGAEVKAASPTPGEALMTRVLADAAALAPPPPALVQAPGRARRGGWIFGWSASAAAVALSLMLGVGLGLQVDLTGAEQAGVFEAQDDTLALLDLESE